MVLNGRLLGLHETFNWSYMGDKVLTLSLDCVCMCVALCNNLTTQSKLQMRKKIHLKTLRGKGKWAKNRADMLSHCSHQYCWQRQLEAFSLRSHPFPLPSLFFLSLWQWIQPGLHFSFLFLNVILFLHVRKQRAAWSMHTSSVSDDIPAQYSVAPLVCKLSYFT